MKIGMDRLLTSEDFAYSLELSDEEYFGSYANYVTAHKIVEFSRDPQKFFHGSRASITPDVLIFGAAAHKIILEGQSAFERDYLVYDGNDAFGAAGRFVGRNSRRWKGIAEDSGFPPDRILLKREYDRLIQMRNSFLSHKISDDFVDCQIERTFRWSQHGLSWQGKMDAHSASVIYDLKTTRSLFHAESSFFRYSYDMQAAVYASAFRAVFGITPIYRVVFLEKDPPYGVFCKEVDEMTLLVATEDITMFAGQLVTELKERGYA